MVDSSCKGCIYLSSGLVYRTCDYLLRTGRSRGCHSGNGCPRYAAKGRITIRRFAEEVPDRKMKECESK